MHRIPFLRAFAAWAVQALRIGKEWVDKWDALHGEDPLWQATRHRFLGKLVV